MSKILIALRQPQAPLNISRKTDDVEAYRCVDVFSVSALTLVSAVGARRHNVDISGHTCSCSPLRQPDQV